MKEKANLLREATTAFLHILDEKGVCQSCSVCIKILQLSSTNTSSKQDNINLSVLFLGIATTVNLLSILERTNDD